MAEFANHTRAHHRDPRHGEQRGRHGEAVAETEGHGQTVGGEQAVHRHTDTWRGGEAFIASSCACPSVILAPSSPLLALSVHDVPSGDDDGWMDRIGRYLFFIFHFSFRATSRIYSLNTIVSIGSMVMKCRTIYIYILFVF